MKKFDKWVFPDSETHIIENMKTVSRLVDGRLAYQYSKYESSKKYINNFRTAIDVGAHVGLWSFYMANDFQRLEAFEPIKENYECWINNLDGKDNVTLHSYALGECSAMVGLKRREGGSTGDTEIIGVGDVYMVTLDSLEIDDVDFIKVDCEGYELNILKGAEKTLLKCKPCVIVEQKGDMSLKYDGKKLGAVEYLQSLGSVLREEISGDYILSWD